LLVTDPTFKVGVESQKHHVHGILNCGLGHCIVEQVQDEDKLDTGEWFFTSGEDRVFPRGFPVGTVISSQPGGPGQGMRDVKLTLSGQPGGAEAVLVVLEGIHQDIPNGPVMADVHVAPLPLPQGEKDGSGSAVDQVQTEADKVVGKYQAIGKEENHVYGAIGSNVPDFNPQKTAPPAPATTATTPAVAPVVKPATPAVVQPAPVQALPLGSPKRKSPATTSTQAPVTPSPQAPQL
jgi:hypothetical protein